MNKKLMTLMIAVLATLVSCSPLTESRIQYPHGTYVKVLDGYRGVVIESHPKACRVYYEDYYYRPHIGWFRNENIFHAEQP